MTGLPGFIARTTGDRRSIRRPLFIGYLFGVRSERQLVREIEVNVAYRWFLGLKLTDPVFDASTLSQNRRRRYNDTTVAQDIFDAIVEQAMAKGLVDGTVLYGLDAPEGQRQHTPLVVAHREYLFPNCPMAPRKEGKPLDHGISFRGCLRRRNFLERDQKD